MTNTTNAYGTHNICLYRTREVKFFESSILEDKYITSDSTTDQTHDPGQAQSLLDTPFLWTKWRSYYWSQLTKLL